MKPGFNFLGFNFSAFNFLAGFKVLTAAALLHFSSMALADMGPDQLVKKTAEEVIEVIKSDKDIQSGNKQKVFALAEEKIMPNFNFDRVSRLVLGKNYSSASKDQQQAFQKEFRTLLLNTYASALSKYRNQKIDFKPLRAQPEDKKVTVKTEIIQSGAQPIAIDYKLAKEDDGAWKVYDIVIENISLVTNYRSQFNEEIKVNGMDGLIKKLADKNKAAS